MLVALACAIGFGMMMSKVIWFWLIPLGLIAALYTIPVIGISGYKKRLRDIAYIKIFLIAITVTWVTVYLPIVNVGADFLIMNEELALLCGERFFFILCITIPFDIRDLHIDKKMGLKTIPTFLGVKKALLLSLVFLALFVVILTYHFISAELLSTTTFIAMMVSTAATALIIAKSTPKRSEYYFSFLVEGTMVIQFLLVLLVN
jgi:4-hydroxybenzoate polyprenyltransferase